ncbi:flavodoxin domain-containing protein [Planobispora siamensis]|uniref:Flavodoxin n=1 Tax=Planobispora siamensis TaxID=936338 RepID=A0A8J3SNE9_9ACTN|nr:flavodoxin domain-containing protein [Planobispora siamensis]GIH92788.1 flavodoxin [Planobispora siamensis]
MRVLVAYGSKNWSTAGIADMIAEALAAEGLEAEARPADEVRAVAGYDAVVLGGALYNNRWHHAARRFARRHAAPLAGKPVWLFSSGPLDDSADRTQVPAVRQADAVRHALGAREHVTFGGCLTDQAKGFIARSIVRNGRGGDFRNPERIAEWSRKIAAELRHTAESR